MKAPTQEQIEQRIRDNIRKEYGDIEIPDTVATVISEFAKKLKHSWDFVEAYANAIGVDLGDKG
jgi:hypothetical protein